MRRLTHRQERFCRHFADCANATAAAKAAGYLPESARNAGYRLLRHPRIVERIASIQGEMGLSQCQRVEVLVGKLETVYRRAVASQNLSAAARAVELQAKLSGWVATRATGSSTPTRRSSVSTKEGRRKKKEDAVANPPKADAIPNALID
jgi:phage terminase small subunit